MKGRLLALLVPPSILAVVLGGAFWAKKMGWLGEGYWVYFWPIVIALAFLALAIVVFFVGARKWIWPFLAGFVVQTIGVMLYAAHVFKKPWEPLKYTFGAVGLVLLVMLIVWLTVTLRARWLEKRMLDNAGKGAGADQAAAEKIRKDMIEALDLLKRAGRGRNAIYELPWVLVIGRSQVGKTVAIKNSGLGLPVKKDWIKGRGGTHSCDWFFTNDLIFLDTPGGWSMEGAGEEGQGVWRELLRLLRRYRGRRPLDGLVVFVSADDLLGKPAEELQEQASNIREVLDLLHDELRFRFPVYLLISKCDLVEGFVDFFRGLPAQRRHQILGWSHDDPNSGDPRQLIPKGFARVLRRLSAYRLEILAKVASTSRARSLFFFPEDFARMQKPLALFADVLFHHDPYHEPPVFRGFYFTSGTQGEGSPLGRAIGEMARSLGVRMPPVQATGEEEPKRSYFLLELFRSLVVGDEGLVARTAGHWWRRRRDTFLAAFLPAGIAAVILLFSCVSYLLNRHNYVRIEEQVPRIVERLRSRDRTSWHAVLETRKDLDALRDLHYGLKDLSLFRRWGMRRASRLEGVLFRLYRTEFEAAVLRPTLERTRAYVGTAAEECTNRIQALESAAWLARGERTVTEGKLDGFLKAWGVTSADEADAEELRELYLDNFSYIADHLETSEEKLPGFSLSDAALDLGETCNLKGAGASLLAYATSQSRCERADSECDYARCVEGLRAAVRAPSAGADLRAGLGGLLEDLGDLERGGYAQAGLARKVLAPSATLGEEETACFDLFGGTVVPPVKDYLEAQKRLVKQCRDAVEGDLGLIAAEIKTQEDDLKEKQEPLKNAFEAFNSRCPEQPSLKLATLTKSCREYRRAACAGRTDQCEEEPSRPQASAAPPPRPGPSPAPVGGAAAPPVRLSSLRWLVAPQPPGGAYTKGGWQDRQKGWTQEIAYANSLAVRQRDPALAKVRREVANYGEAYSRAWKSYLSGLQVRGNEGGVSAWLEELSRTEEYVRVLQPAAQALGEVDPGSEPEFAVFGEKIAGLRNVRDFLDGKLGQYVALLAEVAAAVNACEEDSSQLRRFVRQLDARSEENALVKARAWVTQHGGSTLATGSLTRLLEGPIEAAESWARNPDQQTRQWSDVPVAFEKVKGRFPFTQGSTTPAGLKDVQALFGRKEGLVPGLREGEARMGLGRRAAEWLEAASSVSEILFKPGSDEPEPLALDLKILTEQFAFDPPDLEDDYRVERVVMDLGNGQELSWGQGDRSDSGDLAVTLLGNKAVSESAVTVTLGKKEGLRRKFEKQEPQQAGQATGAWAPLKLIREAVSEVASPETNTYRLHYSVKVPISKKKEGKVTVVVRVGGENLGRALVLLDRGLPEPPATPDGR